MVAVTVCMRLHHHHRTTLLALRERTSVPGGDLVMVVEQEEAKGGATLLQVKGGRTDEGGGGGRRRDDIVLEGKKTKKKDKKNIRRGRKDGDSQSTAFLDCLKFRMPPRVQQPVSALKGTGKKRSSSLVGTIPLGPVTPGGESSVPEGAAAVLLGESLGSRRRAPAEPLLPRDDLRAYAYEGEGSSSGSLTSAIQDLKAELGGRNGDLDDVAACKMPLVPEFLEVMDLLKNLPDASCSAASPSPSSSSSSFPTTPVSKTGHQETSSKCPISASGVPTVSTIANTTNSLHQCLSEKT